MNCGFCRGEGRIIVLAYTNKTIGLSEITLLVKQKQPCYADCPKCNGKGIKIKK